MYIYKIIILCGLLLGSVGLKAQEAQCSIDRKLRADSTNRNRIITRATMYGVGCQLRHIRGIIPISGSKDRKNFRFGKLFCR